MIQLKIGQSIGCHKKMNVAKLIFFFLVPAPLIGVNIHFYKTPFHTSEFFSYQEFSFQKWFEVCDSKKTNKKKE